MAGNDSDGAGVLVVDDDDTILRFVESTLRGDGFQVSSARSAEEALALLGRRSFDLLLSDLRMPGMSGVELLTEVRRREPQMPVVIATAHGSVDSAVEAMRAGAADYVLKPVSPEDLLFKVRRALRLRNLEAENRWLHAELAQAYGPGHIVAVSRPMREVVETIAKLSRTDASVLLEGESGTGKELLARALHFGGARSAAPFVAVNCAAIPAGLIESELFGHARGSFTGAVRDSMGKMELAHRGTLFLDEVGELPLELQPKLLRVLQERVIERVGEQRLRRVDVRVVSATNGSLEDLVRRGRFREDLYYRLAVVPVQVPPLRERPEDVPPLVNYFLRRLAGDDAPEVHDEAMALLTRRPWRGNVRELGNVIERVLALHGDGPILAGEIPGESALGSAPQPAGAPARPAAGPSAQSPGPPERLVPLPEGGAPLDAMVRDLVRQALERSSWNQSAAARMLRIPRHVLQYRMQKYGIIQGSAE